MKTKGLLLLHCLITISCVFISHYTENFKNENPFHKVVYILPAVSKLGCIAGPVCSFTMGHFVDLCAICAWPSQSLYLIWIIILIYICTEQRCCWHLSCCSEFDEIMKALKWPFTSLSTAPPLSTTSDDYSRLENAFILLLKLQQLYLFN